MDDDFCEAQIAQGEADADAEWDPGPPGLPVHGLLHGHRTGHGIGGGAEDGQHAVPQRLDLLAAGSVYVLLADHRHQLFPPEAFGDLTRQGRGHPAVPAEVVASVMVPSALEGLSDREASARYGATS